MEKRDPSSSASEAIREIFFSSSSSFLFQVKPNTVCRIVRPLDIAWDFPPFAGAAAAALSYYGQASIGDIGIQVVVGGMREKSAAV